MFSLSNLSYRPGGVRSTIQKDRSSDKPVKRVGSPLFLCCEISTKGRALRFATG